MMRVMRQMRVEMVRRRRQQRAAVMPQKVVRRRDDDGRRGRRHHRRRRFEAHAVVEGDHWAIRAALENVNFGYLIVTAISIVFI